MKVFGFVCAVVGVLALVLGGAAPAEAEIASSVFARLGTDARPVASVVDAAGNLYLLNEGDATVSKVTPAGAVTRVFASLGARVSPQAMTIDPKGYLYIACGGTDSVTRVSPSGATISFWAYDGVGSMPRGITSDAAGNVFVSNWGTSTITKISSTGAVQPVFARLAPDDRPLGLATDTVGNLYSADTQTDRISKISPTGTVQETFATLPRGSDPVAVAVDPWGSVFTANSAGTVSTFGADGSRLVAALPSAAGSHRPTGVLLDAYGDVFVPDELSGSLWAVDSAGTAASTITTFAGRAIVRAVALSDGVVYAADYVTGDIRRAELTPSLSSPPLSGSMRRNVPVSIDVEATGFLPQVIVSVGVLPAGLRLDERTGHLSGTPTTLGTSAFDLLVLNHWGVSVPRHEVITVVR